MVQHITDKDKVARQQFCVEMFDRIAGNETFLENVIFSDESMFHISGKVNTRNCRIWGSENPHETLQHICDSPQINVFFALSKQKVYSPFFFQEATINGIVYLDMLCLLYTSRCV